MMRLRCEQTTDFISCISASHKMWDTGPKPGFQKCRFVERDVYIWKLEGNEHRLQVMPEEEE